MIRIRSLMPSLKLSTVARRRNYSSSSASYDVVIVGGGVIGSATAYFLAAGNRGLRVAVVERDSTYQFSSTTLSAASIRLQFSTPENILMSKFGADFIKNVNKHLQVDDDTIDLSFHEGGYLFLASDLGVPTLTSNTALQQSLGASTVLLPASDLKSRFPWLSTEGLACGSLGLKDEGWFDAYALLSALRRKAVSLGVKYIAGEVTGLRCTADRVEAVKVNGEELVCGTVVNAAGPQAARVAEYAGVDLPVRPRRRQVFAFECPGPVTDCPLVIDPSGLYFRPDGHQRFICGRSPGDGESDPDAENFTVDDQLFEETLWPLLAARVPAFEQLRLIRGWAGLYEYNTIDQNAILGPVPGKANFLLANGFSGHGLQQAPAAGRAISELITAGRYTTLDLSRFGYDRFAAGLPIIEANVV
eukprot:Colp12_sorted_trinity150504_noHs@35483